MTKVFVGMSGGVDSSVAAALLVEAGYDVTGVYMKNWSQDLPGARCPWAEDLADAKRVAVSLGIDLKVYDFEAEYKQKVVDYMLREYQAGRTPNPDVMCNQEIKFKLFLETALADGADLIATGHYARVRSTAQQAFVSMASRHDLHWLASSKSWAADISTERLTERLDHDHSLVDEKDVISAERLIEQSEFDQNFTNGSVALLQAHDVKKDQTYFLYRVTKEALAKTLFPLGDLLKTEVRRLAEERGLITAAKKDSVGICFVGQVGIEEFLAEYIDLQAGPIVDIETGKQVGLHRGAILYTIGQRHGLDVGGGMPYYVVDKNIDKNIVYVSQKLTNPKLWLEQISIIDSHWINQPPVVGQEYQVRNRHLGKLETAKLIELTNKTAIFKLSQSIRAVTPGQSLVVYDGEVCLGGGIIN